MIIYITYCMRKLYSNFSCFLASASVYSDVKVSCAKRFRTVNLHRIKSVTVPRQACDVESVDGNICFHAARIHLEMFKNTLGCWISLVPRATHNIRILRSECKSERCWRAGGGICRFVIGFRIYVIVYCY